MSEQDDQKFVEIISGSIQEVRPPLRNRVIELFIHVAIMVIIGILIGALLGGVIWIWQQVL